MSELSLVKGSCLCGAVKIAATNASKQVGACHCGMCRKWGGSSFLAIDCSSQVDFEGEDNIKIYQSSEWAERGFCQQCGTHLFYRLKQNNQYHMPVGIFDDADDLVFHHQIFIDEKPEFYSFANQTQNMTGAETIAMFSSLLTTDS